MLDRANLAAVDTRTRRGDGLGRAHGRRGRRRRAHGERAASPWVAMSSRSERCAGTGLAALTADGSASPTGARRSAGRSGRSRRTAPRSGVRRRPILARREPDAAKPRHDRPREPRAWRPGGPTVNSGVWAIAPSGDGADRLPRRRVHDRRRQGTAAARGARRRGRRAPAVGAPGASAVVRSLVAGAREELWVGGPVHDDRRRATPRRRRGRDRERTRDGWEATANGNVEAVVTVGEVVYVAGPFTAIGGRSRKHLAALDAADGSATRWDPAPDDVVRAIAVGADGDAARRGRRLHASEVAAATSAAFDLATGFVTDWRPVRRSRGSPSRSGRRARSSSEARAQLAVFRWPPPPL